jgi:protein-glutamine gamma-glutamyltransferase
MIRIGGASIHPAQLTQYWSPGSDGGEIIDQLHNDPALHSYRSYDELAFEVTLRINIIDSSKEQNQSEAQFTIFENSRCNPNFWNLTGKGGFLLKRGVRPSAAIRDIYTNSSQYAFECATAILIVYYDAVLKSIGAQLFDQLFQNLHLYSWHADSDLGLISLNSSSYIAGDVTYFKNPDFDPARSYWRGENAVALPDEQFYGHGIGIKSANEMIEVLNDKRIQGATQSAYLMNLAVRPSFKRLFMLSTSADVRAESQPKRVFRIVHHNETSISYRDYMFYVSMVAKT